MYVCMRWETSDRSHLVQAQPVTKPVVPIAQYRCERREIERERAQHSFLSNTWYTRVCALRPLERGATQRTDRKKEIEHKCQAVFIAIVINAHCSCSSFSMKRLMYYICVCLTSNEHKQHSEQKQKGLTQPPRTCRSTASVAIARHSFCKTYYYSLL